CPRSGGCSRSRPSSHRQGLVCLAHRKPKPPRVDTLRRDRRGQPSKFTSRFTRHHPRLARKQAVVGPCTRTGVMSSRDVARLWPFLAHAGLTVRPPRCSTVGLTNSTRLIRLGQINLVRPPPHHCATCGIDGHSHLRRTRGGRLFPQDYPQLQEKLWKY